MARRRHQTISSSSPTWTYALAGLVVAIGVYAAYMNIFTSTVSLSASQTESMNSIPSYEQYIELSKRNKWSPVDPVDKLISISNRNSQVFDIHNKSNSIILRKLVSSEIQFILSVLARSAHRKIDLTRVLFEAVEGVHRGLYHVQKQVLQQKQFGIITRGHAEHMSKEFLYTLITALLQMKSRSESSDGDISHIVMDMGASIGREGLGLLPSAVNLMLYRLYQPLLSAGAPWGRSLQQAVINRDEVSVALLLRSGVPLVPIPHGTSGIISPPEAALACSMGLPSLGNMIHSSYLSTTSSPQGPDICQSISGFSKGVRQSVNLLEDSFNNKLSELSGFKDLNIMFPTDTSTGRCHVEVLEGEDISPDEFVTNFVLGRKPVLLRGAVRKEMWKDSWKIEKLIAEAGGVRVTPQTIPYQDQLSLQSDKSGESATLEQYISSMRFYTDETEKWMVHNNVSARSLLNKYGGVNGEFLLPLPEYVFDNKVLSSQRTAEEVLREPFGSSSAGIVRESNEASFLLDELIRATEDVLRPSEVQKRGKVIRQFFMGPALSGAPFHSHGPAFNALVHGKKLWMLLPPGRDLYSNIPPLQWGNMMDVGGENSKDAFPYEDAESEICHVLQQAGDVMFVPSMWTHQILNLAENVGFATEILY